MRLLGLGDLSDKAERTGRDALAKRHLAREQLERDQRVQLVAARFRKGNAGGVQARRGRADHTGNLLFELHFRHSVLPDLGRGLISHMPLTAGD